MAPISQARTGWETILRKIQDQPLALRPDFPEVTRRWNDWWKREGDRPLLIADVRKTDAIRWDKCFDLIDQPEAWVGLRRQQVLQTHFGGESLPFVRVDIGPVAMAAFLGCPLHLAQTEQTSWQEPVIASWENWEPPAVDPNNPWLRKTLALMERLADDARGQYLVCLPDLTGAIDTIANMRSPQKLCFDLYDHRQAIQSAAMAEVDEWEKVFSRMYDLVLGRGAGVTQWISCWADSPFTVPTCDFTALIGPDDFQEVCLPSLKEQARRAGLCFFHLDGPEAARHARALAEDPDITAVQYTPGAATPSALAKIPMFRMFQQHNVPLFIDCPLHEVKELAETLEPNGLALRVSGLKSVEEAVSLVEWRDQTFARPTPKE